MKAVVALLFQGKAQSDDFREGASLPRIKPVPFQARSELLGLARCLSAILTLSFAACGPDLAEVRSGDDELGDTSQPLSALRTVLVNASGHGQIVSPERCSELIGAGGNYVEGATHLSGKCNNAGISPRIVSENGDSHIQFGTNGATGNGAMDRSELAHTTMYPFGTKLFIGFEFRLPANIPSNLSQFSFTALQLWQCGSAPPIAGMTVTKTSTGTYSVTFMPRHNNAGVLTHTYTIQSNRWYKFEIAAKPDVNGAATFQVWVDGRDLGTWRGNFGVGNDPLCPREYRIKWGIYKGSQPGAQFRSDFKNFRIGRTKSDLEDAPQPPAPPATVGNCLIKGGRGQTLFENRVRLSRCESECAEFARDNSNRSCLFNGRSIR